jgi:hypothetical protein
MSTKLSVEQATELFKKMEMEVVVVADEEEADKAPDIDNMAKAAFSEIEAKIENEKGAELKAAGAAAESGKQMGILRAALKRTFGFEEKEIAELSTVDMMKLVKEKSSANKADADNDLMKRLEDLQKDLEAKDTDWQKKYEGREAELMDQFTSRDIKDRVFGLVNSIPRIAGDPQVQADAIYQELKNKFHLKINDNKEIELWDKANPEKKAFDGKNVMTDKYAVDKYLTQIGVKAVDTSKIKPIDVVNQKPTGAGIGIGQATTTDALEFVKNALQPAQ